MKETYFVIRNSDGDTTVNAVSKEELLEQIEEGDFGKEGKDILSFLPENIDTNYWGDGILIIKGKIVVPRGEFVITKFNIE
jgi:hypothetical protein